MSKNPYITEDLEFLAETVEKFAQKYIAPGFLERDQSRVFDRELVKKMGDGLYCTGTSRTIRRPRHGASGCWGHS